MFWDGTRWISPRSATPAPRGPQRRLRDWIATAIMFLLLAGVALPSGPAAADVPQLSLSPASGLPGTRSIANITGLPRGVVVQLTWDGNAAQMPTATASGNGHARVRFVVPASPAGPHKVTVLGVQNQPASSSKRVASLAVAGLVLATASFNVLAPSSVTPAPSASPVATPPAPAATPDPTPTPAPTVVPATPTPAPVAPGCSVLARVDPTGSSDVTSALQSLIDGAPNGSTICLANGGQYRVDGELHLGGRTGITLDGNGSTIFRSSLGTNAILLIDAGSSNIAVRELTLDGANDQPGVWRLAYEHQHGIQIGGVVGMSISNVTIRNVGGDGLYLSGGYSGSTLHPADGLQIHGVVIDGTGRNGISITDGANNANISGNVLRNIGYYTFDIEPNGHGLGAEYVAFTDNQLGPHAYSYNPNVHGYVFAITGSSGGGPAEHIDFDRNALVGMPFRVGVFNNGGSRIDINVSSNTTDTATLSSVARTVEFYGVDGLGVTTNVGFSNASVLESGCTSVTISGNSG